MNLAFALLTQIDLILVNKLFSSADASTFASAAILGRTIIYLPGAMVLAMFPMVSETKARNKSTHPILFKSIGMTILTSGFGALLFFFWSKPILHLFFGERYLGSAEILKYYALAMLPMGLLTILTQYLIARGHALFGYVVLAGAALEIGLIYWLHSSLLSIVSIVGTVGIILFSVGFIFSLIEKPATLVEPYEIAPTVGA
jgi:O-antigen/teichoic acid export membrane protein